MILEKELSQPSAEKTGSLNLENLNTNTHRLLITNDSVEGRELETRGLQTKRPSHVHITGDNALDEAEKSQDSTNREATIRHKLIFVSSNL